MVKNICEGCFHLRVSSYGDGYHEPHMVEIECQIWEENYGDVTDEDETIFNAAMEGEDVEVCHYFEGLHCVECKKKFQPGEVQCIEGMYGTIKVCKDCKDKVQSKIDEEINDCLHPEGNLYDND